MANRLKMAMIEVISALRRRGWSRRRIGRELGIHRETVGRYLAQAGAGSKPANAPIGSDEVLAASKPANAPIGSDEVLAASKPANAPIGSVTELELACGSAGSDAPPAKEGNPAEDKPVAVALTDVSGHVKFEDVTFRYFKGGEPVLNHVSLEAKPGQTVALLGATGSGKTTIINLIPRFYDVSEGRVLIDRHDVRDVTLESLRANIGIVLQETTLFSGTIRENIAFGRPDATLEHVIAAAKAAEAHDFIMEFPEGYNTPVGERGSTLSGGQKQRVAIARALLLNPRILILDDSTSSVDLATEYRIQQALTQLMKGRTSFVIAQRISTVVNADQILVLERGQIVARGTHEELLETSEIYADIYTSQLMEDVVVEQPALEHARA